MEEHLWVVYGVRLKHDDEYRYIGLTRKGASVRFADHLKYSKKLTETTPFMCWLRKHGQDKVTYDVIEECEPGDEITLNFREQFWIATMDQLHASGTKKKPLLNMTEGGGSTIHIFTDEWRRKASDRYSGEGNPMHGKDSWALMDPIDRERRRQEASKRMTGEGNHQYGKTGELGACYGRTGELHPMFGTHHSDEAKAKISAASKGRVLTAAQRENLAKRNRERAKTPQFRLDSQRAMHNRWHVNRNMINPACQFCEKSNDE